MSNSKWQQVKIFDNQEAILWKIVKVELTGKQAFQ